MLSNIFFLSFTLNVFFITSSYAGALQPYVVFMDREEDTSLNTSRTWQEEIIESISISNQDDDDDEYPSPQLHNAYDFIATGFSAMLTEQHLNSLKQRDDFVYAINDELLSVQTTHSPQFLGLRKGEGLWSAQNLASNVIIGLVDTGIWPEHPSFDDSDLMTRAPARWKGTTCETGTNLRAASNCNKKLIGAAAFFKAYESIEGRINETSDDYRSARDSQGHGTHTASTAGGKFVRGAHFSDLANGNATGMRPTARIATYKACFKLGCYGSDVLAAIEQAVKDGVDVLSLSIGVNGGGVPYYNDTIAIGAFGAIRNGVIVSASAGNDGPDSYTVSNVAPWLMTVAASSTDRSFRAHVRLGDGMVFSGTPLLLSNTESLPLVYDETSRNTTLCVLGSLSPSLVKGKIVICVRGGISIFEKGKEVKAAGGAGMILADRAGDGQVPLAFSLSIPALSLAHSEANAVILYAKSSSSPTATIELQRDVLGNRAPVMPYFSSRGPNRVDPHILKPDVTAPGVDILAAWPPNARPTRDESEKRRRSLFNIMSGTSMSCPHVSGLMALLKSLHPDWSPAAIKSALMTTAYVYDSQNKPISDWTVYNGSEAAANPFVFGSGHVDPERAADPGMIYDISARDYLNYLMCGLGYNSTQMALFVGKGQKTTNCPNGSRVRPAGDLNYPSFSVVFSRNITTSTYMRRVTNVGNGVSNHNYSVKVTEPQGVSITVRPAVLHFSKMGEKQSYKVTFDRKKTEVRNFSFGHLEWVSCEGKYSVRSPVAVTWIE